MLFIHCNITTIKRLPDILKMKGIIMPELINSQEPITIDFLRKCFHENDFTTIPVKDPLEYDESELKLYNRILTIVNTEWKTISKELGLNHPQSCYSNEYSAELLRERVQKIIADNVIKLVRNDKSLENVTDTFVIPILLDGESGDEQLHNTVKALMKAVDVETLAEILKKFSCDEDFNTSQPLNYPRKDHERKWNHSRSKTKAISLDEIAEKYEDDIPDYTNIEMSIEANPKIEYLRSKNSEQDNRILELLLQQHTQSEIAKKIGIAQSTVSKKQKNFQKILSEME